MKILSHEDILQQLDHPFFRLISDTAEELALECYVIGGWVRDLYLERPSSDIDIVVVDPTQQTKRPASPSPKPCATSWARRRTSPSTRTSARHN